jgi:hypothetical protein
MMLIHLIIILINSLSMLIIIVEHLFVWFIHVLGGDKATLLLLQHVMHIASFILHWKLCRVSKVTTYRYNILDATPYLVGYAGRRHIAFAFICIGCTVGRDVLSLFLLEVYSL